MQQHTLHTSFCLAGKGLHTGLIIHACFLPAPVGTGVRICRTDLPGQPCYEALADYVSTTERGTVLENGAWRVSTVEHALSALYALGVSNCLIELDAPEMPILDGSARPFAEAVLHAGIDEQPAPRKRFAVKQTVTFDNGHGSSITLTPADSFSLEVGIGFPSPVLGSQSAGLDSLEDYAGAIAPARTFVFLREVQPLLQMGLIKGGDLQNAVVIYDQPLEQTELDRMADTMHQPRLDAARLGYLTPLLFDNEPARHKLLDLIGDLSLLGAAIQGKVTAVRPGHSINTAFCRQLRQLMTASTETN